MYSTRVSFFFAENLCDSLPDEWSELLSIVVSREFLFFSAKSHNKYMYNDITECLAVKYDIILETFGRIMSLAVSDEVSEAL